MAMLSNNELHQYKITIKMGKPAITYNSIDLLYNPKWLISEWK